MTWEQFGIIISLAALIFGIVYFVGDKLLDQLFYKSKKLEAIKEEHTKEAIDRIDSILKDLRSELADVQKVLRNLNGTISAYDSNNKKLIELLTTFAKETRSRIDSIEKSELVDIGSGKFILRKRG